MEPTQKFVHEMMDYNPDSGVFVWKNRPRHHFLKEGNMNAFNAKYPGEVAGGINSRGYMTVLILGKSYRLHRIAWLHYYGEAPHGFIDHINGVKDDNRILNLRECTNKENNLNYPSRNGSSSRHKGVNWDKKSSKWKARIGLDGEQYFIGIYESEDVAAIAYNKMAIELHGEFARLNNVCCHNPNKEGSGLTGDVWT